MDNSFMNTVQSMRSRRTQPVQQQPNYVQMQQPQVQQQDPTDYLLNIFGVAPQTQQPSAPQTQQPSAEQLYAQKLQQEEQLRATFNYPNIQVGDNPRQMAYTAMLRTKIQEGMSPDELRRFIPESNYYILDNITDGGLNSDGSRRQNLAEQGPSQGTWGQRR